MHKHVSSNWAHVLDLPTYRDKYTGKRPGPIVRSFCIVLTCIMMSFLLAGGIVFQGAYAAAAAPGQCGEDIWWEFEESIGTLIISGQGAMWDFESLEEVPWARFADSIRRIVFLSGITTIGKNAFAGCSVETIAFPDTLTVIRENAFLNCDKLVEADISQPRLVRVEAKAFSGCQEVVFIAETAFDQEPSDPISEAIKKRYKVKKYNVSGKDLSALIGNLDETAPTELITEETTEVTTEPTEPDYGQSGKIVNILLIGQGGWAGEEALLADTIILFTLNKETKTLRMTSFLRDSYVKLPEYYRGHTCGWNRINASYALGYSWYGTAGAMEMLNLTLENNYGVKVDGNVEVNFDTFQKVVDAIGGVDVDLRGKELTKMLEYQGYRNAHFEYVGIEKRFDLQEGINTLDGYLALAYARERHMSNADSDIQRTARQRKVIEGLLSKLSKMSLSQINSLIDEVLGQIVTDISTDDMKMYITELLPYLFDLKLESYQVPAEGTYWGEMVDLPAGPSGVLKIDFPKNKQVVAAIQSGDKRIETPAVVSFGEEPTETTSAPAEGTSGTGTSSGTTVATPTSGVLKLKKTDITFSRHGVYFTLELENGISADSVKWSTSDSSVANVYNGQVTAMGRGTCVIRAEYNGQVAECIVRCKF